MNCVSCGRSFELPRQKHLLWATASEFCLDCVASRLSMALTRAQSISGIPEWPEGREGRTIGIEVECNPSIRSAYRANLAGGKLVREGSLRGAGIEVVSPILREDNVNQWVTEAFSEFKNQPYNRQGLHLWLGVPEMGWFEVYNILRHCFIHEEDYFSLVSPSRANHGNNMGGLPGSLREAFSVPPRAFSRRQFIKMLYGTDPERLSSQEGLGPRVLLGRRNRDRPGISMMKASSKCNCHGQGTVAYPGPISRYWWMNIHGYFHRRAIEVRIHHGVTSPEKIVRWKDLWIDLLPKISRAENLHVGPMDLASPGIASYYRARARVYSQMRGAMNSGEGAPVIINTMNGRSRGLTRQELVA